MRMYSTSHSPRCSGWKPLLHMPQPAKCTMNAGLSTHGLSMSSHLRNTPPTHSALHCFGDSDRKQRLSLNMMRRLQYWQWWACGLIAAPDHRAFCKHHHPPLQEGAWGPPDA